MHLESSRSPLRGVHQGARRRRSMVAPCAIVLSGLIHAGLLVAIANVTPGVHAARALKGGLPPLRVQMISATAALPNEIHPPLLAMLPASHAVRMLSLPDLALAAIAPVGSARASTAQTGAPVAVPVAGEPLRAYSRLGDDIIARMAREFPVEIEWPVRVYRIGAQYPPAALAQRIEGDVIAWILVDANGQPQEIQIVEGSPEFADAVIAAIHSAQFQPAAHNGRGIAFPIALEFRFTLPKGSAPAEASVRVGSRAP